ncbi:MAG: murein hydrolase activator EnvC [Thermoanaerobaculia bacterium]
MTRALCAALLFGSFAAIGSAAEADPDRERRDDLSRLRSRIATLKSRLTESEKKVATLSEELNRWTLRLEIAEREEDLLAAAREDLTKKLAETQARRGLAAAEAAKSRAALVSRARVLHRFGRYGYFRVVLEARDVPALLQGLERLDALARRDGALLAKHRSAERALAEDVLREEAMRKELDGLHAASRRERARIASFRDHRRRLLEKQRDVAASGRREVIALSDKALRLERLLETLARQSEPQPAGASGGIRPWKGVLDWPARGALVETFGRHRHPRFDAWTISNGIAIALPAGAPVRAVYAGRAVYAQWLAEYGNLVIVDHGDAMFTLYAWLQGIAVTTGSYVPVGTTVGWAGVGPGRAEPGLYFEVRDKQKASDPVAWLR